MRNKQSRPGPGQSDDAKEQHKPGAAAPSPYSIAGLPAAGMLPGSIMQLQRAAGNRAMLGLLQAQAAPVQLKEDPGAAAAAVLHSLAAQCGCGLCAAGGGRGEGTVSMGSGIVQRAKLGGQAEELDNDLADYMNEIWHSLNPQLREAFNNLYGLIDSNTNAATVKDELLRLGGLWNDATLIQLGNNVLTTSIRTTYYPTSFNQTAKNNRDHYVQHHPGTAPNTWTCPGYNTAAHNAGTDDVTIDHVNPVAWHWNTTGYQTDKATRSAWYNDITNHVILCRSCNSSKGSGGIHYNQVPDYTNGFSH